jgi:diguanylate cyclase (GGDEF)-like protein
VADSESHDLFDEEEEESTALVKLGSVGQIPTAIARDRYVLVQVQGEELGRIIALDNNEFVVGRQQTCDLPLIDGSVSRRHARIRFVDDRHVLEDLGSANGTYVAEQRISQHVLSDGDLIQFGSTVAFRYSVTDSQQLAMLKYLYDASVTDALTGVYNREYFDARLLTEIAYSKRHGTALSLLMFDVDHFKRINDTYGHPVGDQALVKLVESVRTKLRAEDVFCRYGGEEFVTILRTTDLDAAACAAERIRQAVEQVTLIAEGVRVRLTVSIGCASLKCTEDAAAIELVAIADRRLYAAKHAGRNRIDAAS